MPKQSLQNFKSDLFKALGHPARIRILELLRPGEMTVSDLQAQLAMESSSVSQQLGVLRAKHIVEGRKVGTSVFYRVLDHKIFDLLDTARHVFANQLIDLQAMAGEEVDLESGDELADATAYSSSPG